MSDLTPRPPIRPLLWPDFVFELQDRLRDYDTPVYIVGGAVRDAYLGRPLTDLDVAVLDGGRRTARFIANQFKGDFFPLDDARDVGRALIDTPEGRLVVDAARFRGDSLLADLRDRDFALNAMAVDLRGDLSLLIDPLGGEGDIAAKMLRQCSDQAIAADPIRALRGVRQSVQLGFRIEAETLRAIRDQALALRSASAERVRDEFIKLLALPKPAAALRVADTVGLLDVIVPEVAPLRQQAQSAPHIHDVWAHTLAVIENLNNVLAVLRYNRSDDLTASFSLGMMAMQLDPFRGKIRAHLEQAWPNERPHRALLMLAALLHDSGKPQTARMDENGRWRFFGHEHVGADLAQVRAEALRLSNDERDRLVTIVRHHMRPLLLDKPSSRAVYRFWRATGAAGVDVCLLSLADVLGTAGWSLEQDMWLAHVDRIRILLEGYFERYDQVVAPPILVDGSTLMRAFDLKPGPIIGQLLDLIREGQAAGEIQSSEEALAAARSHLNGRTG